MALDLEIDECGAGGSVKQGGGGPRHGKRGSHRHGALPSNPSAFGATLVWVPCDVALGWSCPLFHERVFPELASHLERIDAGGLPPGALVACAMNGTMMGAAERHRELIA